MRWSKKYHMEAHNCYALLMAGGIGSRFWPDSTPEKPKQFLDLMGWGSSLLQQTFERVVEIVPTAQIFVLTAAPYREQILEQLPDLSPEQLICEPVQRNTAPCNLIGALKIKALNPEAKMLVVPTDHLIQDQQAFARDIRWAFEHANDTNLITFGVTPQYPATGYGYIKRAEQGKMAAVVSFTEKPNEQLAKTYLQTGKHLWNTGIFVWSAQAILNAFEMYAPDMYAAMHTKDHLWNTESDQAFIDTVFPSLTSISIDYAILENSNSVCVIQAEFDWNDLGSWRALYDEMDKDVNGNVSINAHLFSQTSSGNLIKTQSGKKVMLVGLENYIVVENESVLVIVPQSKDQDIKKLSATAQSQWKKS